MASIYRTPGARAPRCFAHAEDEAVDVCSRCRASLCDACSTCSPAGVACLACAAFSRALRAIARVCAALVTTVACAAIAVASLDVTGRPPPGKGAWQALERARALRYCDEPATLLALLHLDAARDDQGVLALARDFDATCGERPMILAMAYRGACSSGDAPAASEIAARLSALPPGTAPSWRGIACAPLRSP